MINMVRALFLLTVWLCMNKLPHNLVLIDKYDTPLNHAYQKRFYDTGPSEFFSRLYENAFKSNTELFRACLIGIVQIPGADIFSGLNNLSISTVADNEYAEYFGFTASEVKALLIDEKSVMMYFCTI